MNPDSNSIILFSPKLSLETHGFGSFNKEVIYLLLSLVDTFFKNVGISSNKKVHIIHREGVPLCVASLDPEESIIVLSAEGNHWCQWIYQYAHEFCHHLIGGKMTGETKGLIWLEESLCHISSYVCLVQFARLCARRLPNYTSSVIEYLREYMDPCFIEYIPKKAAPMNYRIIPATLFTSLKD